MVEDWVVNVDLDSVLVTVTEVGCSLVTVGPGISSVTVVVRVVGMETVTVCDGPACTETTVSVIVRVPDPLMGFGCWGSYEGVGLRGLGIGSNEPGSMVGRQRPSRQTPSAAEAPAGTGVSARLAAAEVGS